MVDLWSKCPIQKLWQIFKPIFMQNFTFSEVPKYSSYFYSLLVIYSIRKRIKNGKNRCGMFSLRLAQRCSASQPDLMRERLATVSHAIVADRWEPHVSPLFPQIPLLCSSVWQRRPNYQRRADHPSPPLRRKDTHVCACRLEPSRRLWYAMVPHHCCTAALLPPVAAPAGMPRQELGAEALHRLPHWVS
jgi:hypothetical protein